MLKQKEDVQKLKRQIELLQRKGQSCMVQVQSNKNRIQEGHGTNGESWYEGLGTLHFIKPETQKRQRGNSFTHEVLEDPLPNHFKPVSYYNRQQILY